MKINFKKIFIVLIIWCFIYGRAGAQHPDAAVAEPPSLVKWMTFKEAQEQNKKVQKPFLVDFYTGWCGWCKHMMKTTYSTPEIANYINSWYYPVKFDAETHDTIYYRDTAYVNKATGPRATHDLTYKFLGNSISYPSTVFITNNFQYALNTAGYLDVRTIEPLLVFVVENIFRSVPYEVFKQNFQKAYYDSTFTENKNLKWYSFNEALALSKTKPKKFIVDIHTSWCNGCKVMNKVTFGDTAIANYINKNFYLVDFNAETKDTINFNGTAYVNDPSSGFPFHKLTTEFTGSGLSLPTIVFLDSSYQRLDVIPYFLSREMMLPITHFYAEDAYKTIKWDDYLKKFQEGSN